MSNRRPVQIAPSLLSADFARLKDEIRLVESAGVDMIHVDVMDGHFVPNITIGPPVVAAISKVTDLPLDCHLMIEEPDKYVEAFADAGASYITVHVESATHLHRTLETIQSLGAKPGVTLNPATPLDTVSEVLNSIDMLLLMSVEPGFSGQSLIRSVFRRARKAREMLDQAGNADCLIEADGGIKLDNVEDVYDSGVDVIVSGSGIFKTSDPVETIRAMRERCNKNG